MALNIMIRVGYFLLFLTLGLMIWVSLSTAKETDNMKFPPCPFNTLCSCSKAAPDLGIVQCRSVPFPAIPESINNSKVFMLHMESTGLRIIEPYFLYATGLYRLEISYNPLSDIPDDAFAGLERTMWELMLQHNRLIEIPSRAFRHLQKLRHLDLTGNQISSIEPDSWRGLENSLQTLILSENSITHLPPDSFSSLPLLDTLDLSGNNLVEIDGNVFRDGMAKLSKLLLSDNLLIEVPFYELSPLKLLRTLDISYNRIQNLLTNDNQNPVNTNIKMTLDNLHLEYNMIDILTPGSFQNFDIVNRTFLDGNPLKTISEDAFRQARIRELYLRHCTLNFISPTAFAGLETTLQILDLSGNNLTSLPEKLFNDFDYLRNLNLRDNQMNSIAPNEMFNGFQFTLFKLDLSGNKNGVSSLQELRRLRNIRSLAVGKLSSQNLVQDDFLEFGVELEDLKIVQASIKSIKSHAFMHVRGLKRLDLSENSISTIESDAFQEIGHSLISLKISHGLSTSLNKLPSEPLRHLSSLQELDITNNKIKTMADTSFHFLKELRILELHDNQIEQIHKGTFQGDIHSKLEEISLSFNNIKNIVQHTFVDLENLEKLHLDDNGIDNLERRAFMNLDSLNYLSLRGNKLSKISDEAFQIEYNDHLPQYICDNCENIVSQFYDNIINCVLKNQEWHENVKVHDTNHISQNKINLIKDFITRQKGIEKLFENPKNVSNTPEVLNVSFKELPEVSKDSNNLVIYDSLFAKSKKPSKKPPKPRANPYLRRVIRKKRSYLKSVNKDNLLDIYPSEFLQIQMNETQDNISCGSGSSKTNNQSFCSIENDDNNTPIIKQEPFSPKKHVTSDVNGCNPTDESSLYSIIKKTLGDNQQKTVLYNSSVTIERLGSGSKNENIVDNLSLNIKRQCRNCKLICDDIKELAKHQMTHLTVKLHNIDQVLILDPRLRRGSYFTVQNIQFIRCLNCLKRYSNATMLKKHWTYGKCDFFCKLCSMNFHDNPLNIPSHVETVHNIKFSKELFSNSSIKHIKQAIPPLCVDSSKEKKQTPSIAKRKKIALSKSKVS